MIARAPGKLILTGEYAVLDGAPALVIAVDRKAIARETRPTPPRGSAPFLVAVAQELAARRGADDPAAHRALRISVDSSAFYDGTTKLGLGSSAAVTVAATALALGARDIDRDLVYAIASAAHANAQGTRGARGSGADIAAAVYGGALAFTLAHPSARRAWPAGATLIPFFTGESADTASLVAQVAEARTRDRAAVDAALAAIGDASRAACASGGLVDQSLAGTAMIAALQLAASATDRLAAATRIPLVPDCVRKVRMALGKLGGTAKTTGAGGGDVAIAVIPATEDATAAGRYLIESACRPLTLAIDPTGVDLVPDAQ